jgi:hypothetical protein
MKYLWLITLVFVSSLSTELSAETSIDTATVKKMVVFIFASRDGIVEENHPLGTGFLIIVPAKGTSYSPTVPSPMKGVLLLVTARHIVDPAWAFCSGPQPDMVFMRLNKANYDASKDRTGVEYIPIHLVEKGVKTYYVNTDDRVDAAIVYLAVAIHADWYLSQEKYDYQPFSLSNFASDNEVKALRIGDSIVSAGLLPGKSGEKRNYPFFKFGDISNIPDEPTWTGCDVRKPPLRLERVWFIAANLVGGNSGSPIFYDPPELCLMGSVLFHCTRGLDRGMIIGVQSESLGDSQFGSPDISGMTPIEDVFAIIQQYFGVDTDLYRGDDRERK